jgi:hypothetical protein
MTHPSSSAARAVAAVAVVFSLGVANDAFAANKSLAAAKDGLPGDVDVLVSADLSQLRATKLFGATFPLLLGASGGQKAIDKVKKACGLDPTTMVDDVTVGMTQKNAGGIYLGMNVTESKFTSCVTSLVKQETGKDVTTKKTGNEIAFTTGTKTMFVMWLAGDVLAFTSEPTDEASLKKFTGGSGALKSGAMAHWLSLTDPDAILLGAITRSLPQKMFTASGGAFSVTDKSSTVTAKVMLDLGSSSDAEQAAKGAGILTSFLSPKNAPPEVDRAIKSLDVKASGSVVTAKASSTEGDLVVIAEWLLKGMP